MKLLTPLGLLGLISLLILLIIYIIRPNYLQRRISSTFVWKLSLKYKKKRIPMSKLRNLLIIICQILALTSCAFILAQPNKVLDRPEKVEELVVVVDSSASMRALNHESTTRYNRALQGVMSDYEKMGEEGVMSVIIADEEPHYLFENKTKFGVDTVSVQEIMLEHMEDPMACSYGSSDMDGAMAMCEEVLIENPDAQIKVYTDTDYAYVPKRVEVVNVGYKGDELNAGEWNAGILNAWAEYEDNYYVFYIEVASYGRDENIGVEIEIQNANADSTGAGVQINFEEYVQCTQDTTQTMVFKYFKDAAEEDAFREMIDENTIVFPLDQTSRVYSYRSVHISLIDQDSFAEDNNFDIYGGEKETLKVLYASLMPNGFFNGIMFVLQSKLNDRWNIEFTEFKDVTGQFEGGIPSQGYDFYIYEHMVPKKVPTDGVVLLVNPNETPNGLNGITIGGIKDFSGNSFNLFGDNPDHPLMRNMLSEDVTISQYVQINKFDEALYDVLMSVDGKPVYIASKPDPTYKVAILSFSLHYSNLSITQNFPLMLLNLFEYYMPATVIGNAFEVNETITFNARGSELTVTNANIFDEEEQGSTVFNTFPAQYKTTIPGTYTLSQSLMNGEKLDEFIYVKIPAIESNIWAQGDALKDPYSEQKEESFLEDLLLYIAAALVALLFIEWLLHLREEV